MKLFGNTEESRRSFGDLTKYIDDFKIETTTDSRGRVRKKAVYTGVWTVLRETGTGTACRLWGALALSVAVAAACAFQLLTEHAYGGKYPVMVPLLAGLFPCLYLVMGCLSLPFRQRPMRRDQYMHSFIRAFRSGTAVLTFQAIGLIASLIYRIAAADWLFLAGDIRFLIAGALVIAFAGGVIWLLRRTEVTERPNGQAGENGQISKEN